MTKFGILVSIVVLVILGGAGFLVFQSNPDNTEPGIPSPVPSPEPLPTSPPMPEPEPAPPVSAGSCYVGGCSGQICSDQEGAISTCEYREEYACYKSARCERQPDGECGWTQTPTLFACLNASIQ
jgi:hypothetical protein